ncbi:MAG: UxaA family hydrolase [Pseudomonadota bacterium]
MTTRDAILLEPADNVATSLRRIEPGETVSIATQSGERHVVAAEGIPIFHKISVAPLRKGSEILKYGDVIGVLTADVDKGGLVHVHNLRSLRAQGEPRR